IYTLGAGGLTLAAEVPVGLEPVAVAARTNLDGRTEAWVVNHLSDTVSIVEVDPTDPTRSRVTQTLLVGDEPRDIVFAGSGHDRAAHGGLPPPPPGSTPGAPSTGLIVQFDPATGHWEDEIGRNWSPSVAFSLPDDDVFLLDADASPPVRTGVVSGVGTVLFNM